MSDLDPSSLIDGIKASPPWWAVIGLSIGGFFARMLLGRHLKSLDTVVTLAKETRTLVEIIDTRVSKLEGRFQERDRIPRDTWPYHQ